MSGNWGWRKEVPITPPPGVSIIDRLVDHYEPLTELERQRRAALKFIADNPDHPLVVEYREALARAEAEEKARTGEGK